MVAAAEASASQRPLFFRSHLKADEGQFPAGAAPRNLGKGKMVVLVRHVACLRGLWKSTRLAVPREQWRCPQRLEQCTSPLESHINPCRPLLQGTLRTVSERRLGHHHHTHLKGTQATSAVGSSAFIPQVWSVLQQRWNNETVHGFTRSRTVDGR